MTRADKPKGRSLQLSPSPVKQKLIELNTAIPVYSPEKASTPEFARVLKQHYPDLFVVVAYGEIIKQILLDVPRWDAINIHASLLPKYRGAAPMQRAIMAGETETGITIIEMVLKMDAGPILEMEKCPITSEMTLGELEEKLYFLACRAIKKVLHQYEEKQVKKKSQEESLATYANKIIPEELEIDWTRPAFELHNLIRAVSPKPAAWTRILVGNQEKRLKIQRTDLENELSGTPGGILVFGQGRLVVACGKGALSLLEVQLEGKKVMPVDEFVKGIHEPLSFLIK